MLRYAWVVAVVAQSFKFDGYERDDLVQRVFLELPVVARRSFESGQEITDPEGWIRHRAHLMARQALREEQGAPVIDIATGAARRDPEGRVVRTRGRRVGVEEIDIASADSADSLVEQALEQASLRDGLRRALAELAREQPVGAEILRMQLNEGCQLNEVATRMGRAHGTIRNDALKARRRLAQIIRERYPDLLPGGAADGASDAIA